MSIIIVLLAIVPRDGERMEWKIGDDVREALVFRPAKKSDGASPLLFAFHGHGGTVRTASRSFRFQEEWPEAVVVYLQGLPTPGKTDPEGRKPGWQKKPGDQGDRDLRFFDTVLKAMKEKFEIDQ